jgi:hypothetical protein
VTNTVVTATMAIDWVSFFMTFSFERVILMESL